MRKTVLLIEDDPGIMMCLKTIFSGLGWDMVFAETSAEVSERSKLVDLVVSDYNVPGVQFEETRAVCEQLGKPLILQSGNMDVAYHPKLMKPWSISELVRLVTSITQTGFHPVAML